jgi:hypothetical protein
MNLFPFHPHNLADNLGLIQLECQPIYHPVSLRVNHARNPAENLQYSQPHNQQFSQVAFQPDIFLITFGIQQK